MTITITLTDTEASLIAMALEDKHDSDLLLVRHAEGMRDERMAFTFRRQAEMAAALIDRMAANNE